MNFHLDVKPGTGTGVISSANRGAFAMHQWNGLAHLVDGTSNTIIASERCVGQNTMQIRQGYAVLDDAAGAATNSVVSATGSKMLLDGGAAGADCMGMKGTGQNLSTAGQNFSGTRWADGAMIYTGFTTILPPNAPSCISGSGRATAAGDSYEGAIISASSNHPGGVNTCMGDGAVKFQSDTIDYKGNNGNTGGGDHESLMTSGKSYHGIWGALGSRNGGESVSP